jgi:hypothetical protein
MDPLYRVGDDVYVLPSGLPIPGVGTLVNGHGPLGGEPVLVGTGLAVDGEAFERALSWIVDPPDIIWWIWPSHDDADQIGNLGRVMSLTATARLLTHGLGALRMSTRWRVPLDRVTALGPGTGSMWATAASAVGDPARYGNPMSAGLLDGQTGAIYTVDAFGAILPSVPENCDDGAEAGLVAGIAGWAAFRRGRSWSTRTASGPRSARSPSCSRQQSSAPPAGCVRPDGRAVRRRPWHPFWPVRRWSPRTGPPVPSSSPRSARRLHSLRLIVHEEDDMALTETAPATAATVRPTLTAIHHVGITVTDVEASAAWYERVLGLGRLFEERHYRSEANGFTIVLGPPDGSFSMGVDHHPANAGDGFDPTRPGPAWTMCPSRSSPSTPCRHG